jgi:hypothetical protein
VSEPFRRSASLVSSGSSECRVLISRSQVVFQTDKHVQEGVAKVKDVKDSVMKGFKGVDSEFKAMKKRLDEADSRFSQLMSLIYCGSWANTKHLGELQYGSCYG